MIKKFNGYYWEIEADAGNALVNLGAKTSALYICTEDENATGWTEMPVEDVPSFEEEDDLTADEALSIITGEVVE